MKKKIIRTEKAPQALGPYSQGVDTGDLIFVSGQVAINPATGKIEANDIAAQTRQVLANIKGILDEAGLDFEHVMKATVYLASMDDFQVMNQVYAEHFTANQPARAAFEVSRLPLDALVEIEAIARR